MDLAGFHLLQTSSGQQALRQATALQPKESDFLSHFDLLRRAYPAELARAALEIAILRQEAISKFPDAGQMYFTRQALEQATNYAVATYRAQRFVNYEILADLGCSVGGDTLALAAVAQVIGVDLDPLRLAMAQANARATGLEQQTTFLEADLLAPLPLHLPSRTGLFFDPARRTQERRAFSVKDYHPPLSQVRQWLVSYPAVGVKISPGVNLDELSTYTAEIEFISLAGELKEAVLWFGPLQTALRRATLLPGPHTLTATAEAADQAPLTVGEPRAFVYEPDPAVLRAGLVQTLGTTLNAAQLDPDIAYLTADQLSSTPFARAWQVEEWFPFNLKYLRSALRARGVGRVVIKKRGSPLQPEALIHDLHLKGDQTRVVFLTHLRGRPIVILSYGIAEV